MPWGLYLSQKRRSKLFNQFDPSLFDDADFKEDSVREEIVVPILKRLGYSASGPNRIVRSKALLHPFVMIGSKRHPIHIVPDYLLHSEHRPAWVLDAKRPDAELVKSQHAEQAYSYAIHPDVRVRLYALCNGRKLVAYDIHGIAPIFEIDFPYAEQDWEVIEAVLSPKNVAHAPERYFAPDFGTAAVKMGFPAGSRWSFPFCKFSHIGQVDDDLFTMTAGVPIAGVDHLASFDIPKDLFSRLLDLTDEANRTYLLERLVVGQMVYAKRPILASIDALVGTPTRGQHDVFVPFLVFDVQPLNEHIMRSYMSMMGGNDGA